MEKGGEIRRKESYGMGVEKGGKRFKEKGGEIMKEEFYGKGRRDKYKRDLERREER